MTTPNVVYLFSLIDVCANCAGVIAQYETKTGVGVAPWSAGFPDGKALARYRGL